MGDGHKVRCSIDRRGAPPGSEDYRRRHGRMTAVQGHQGVRCENPSKTVCPLVCIDRSMELTAVWVPDSLTRRTSSIRDLVRTWAMAIEGHRIKRRHISSFLLPYGRIYGWRRDLSGTASALAGRTELRP